MESNKDVALKIATKVIRNVEGCELRAYPDPASDLYKELSKHGLLRKYMTGELTALPEHLAKLSGAPWTIGYGETKGVKPGMVWTQEQADTALEARVKGFLSDVLKISPKLATEAPERIAAIVSLTYNIGAANYASSTVAKCIAAGDHNGAAAAILLWNKAGKPLTVVPGLVKRRQVERDLYVAVKG
jgi:lysozyme